MTRDPRDTSAEEPDGGNLQVRFRGGPGSGNRPGLLNKSIRLAFILAAATAIACSDDGGTADQGLLEVAPDHGLDASGPDSAPASRSFRLASTPVTTKIGSGTFFVFGPQNLADDVDLISLHNDFIGVPWKAFEDGNISDLPPLWKAAVDEWVKLVQDANKGVFLSLALVGGSGRNTLAAEAGEQDGKLITKDNWALPCFNFDTDPDGQRWRKAYLEYVKYMVGRFKPAYVNHAIEVNMFAAACDKMDPGAFDSVKKVADAAYDAARQAHPQAVVFPSFQIDTMRDAIGDGWCSKGSEAACFTEALARVKSMKRDRFAVSTYPYIVELTGIKFRSTWLDEVAQATGEKLVVAETGGASSDLVYNAGTAAAPSCQVHIAASEAVQEQYLGWLLGEAKRLEMDLVTWWSDRDIYPHALITGCPCTTPQDYCAVLDWFRSLARTPQEQPQAELMFRLFESMGLRRFDGTPKKALATWQSYQKLPLK